MKDKLAKGVFWLGSAKVIINILSILSTLVLARILTPDDFGLVALATTMLAILSAVTELSLASALIHHNDPTDVHFNTAWTLNLIRASFVGLIFCALAPVAVLIYHDDRLFNIMLALGLSVMIMGFNNPKTVVFTRNLVFWQEFVLTVSQKLAGFIVGITVALLFKSYWALVAGAIASQVTGMVVSYIVFPFKPKFSFSHAKELWSFSIWLTLGQIVNTLNWKFDHLLIGWYLGPKALGYYTVGDNLAGLPTRETIAPLETTLFPGFKKIADDPERLQAAYKAAQSLISSIALPVGVGCALIAHPLVLLGMGEKWLPAVDVIQVLSCVFALQTLSSPVHPLAMAKGRTKLLFKRDMISFLMRVPIIIAGMLMGGLIGIIYARGVTGIIAIFINMHLVKTLIHTKITDQLRANLRSFISVILMAITVIGLEVQFGRDGNTMQLIVHLTTFIIGGALVYLGTHMILWLLAQKPEGPEAEVLRLLKKISSKFIKTE